MTYRGHLVGGAASAVLVIAAAPAGIAGGGTGVALVGLALLASLAPDLDAPGAYLSRRLAPLRWVVLLACSNPAVWYVVGRRLLPAGHPDLGRAAVGWWTWALGWLAAPVPAHAARRRAVRVRLTAGRHRTRVLLGHRALSHSVVALVIAAVGAAGAALLGGWLAVRPTDAATWGVVAQTAGWAAAAVAVGYASHIVLDMLTVSGVPLLLPWRGRRYHLLPAALRVRSS